ncbi:hypothetical protein KKP04_06800 [Rhodomicrobium sp. Az07]|uniref:hypothetical protein n=1 Tax=Rhodomicrobium sp. Az07 TaxID=2839034 RepID=UPI001BEBBD6D|nr:hypothetical protein [Rhodomicrobium sp. Az07]MBT3070572.1 hypothetical protein [Rhodomicrobium sp. Az07]
MDTVIDVEPQCNFAENIILSEEQVAEIKARHERRETPAQIGIAMELAPEFVFAALTDERYAYIRAVDLGRLPQPDVHFPDPNLVQFRQSFQLMSEAAHRLCLI